MSKVLGNIPIEKQIDRHMHRWEIELEEWARQSKPDALAKPKKTGPYISFSRDAGSGGDEISKRLADILGWQLFDRNIIEAITERTHYRKELVSQFDEHIQSELQTYLYNLFTNQIFNNTQYLYHLTEVLLGIAHRGNAVIVGRGANFILPPEAGLRVRVVAPRDVRLRRILKAKGCDEKTAARELARLDEEQRSFLHHHFLSKPDDPCAYDVLINTGHIDLQAGADLIVQLANAKLKQRFHS
jgi:cytidylate kinase